jgi:hypothetical protein
VQEPCSIRTLLPRSSTTTNKMFGAVGRADASEAAAVAAAAAASSGTDTPRRVSSDSGSSAGIRLPVARSAAAAPCRQPRQCSTHSWHRARCSSSSSRAGRAAKPAAAGRAGRPGGGRRPAAVGVLNPNKKVDRRSSSCDRSIASCGRPEVLFMMGCDSPEQPPPDA